MKIQPELRLIENFNPLSVVNYENVDLDTRRLKENKEVRFEEVINKDKGPMFVHVLLRKTTDLERSVLRPISDNRKRTRSPNQRHKSRKQQ